MKSALVFPLLALASRVLTATPPACLLNAVNSQQDPSDLGAICGKEATNVQQAIASLCSDNASAAQSAFIATCSGAGSSVGKSKPLLHTHILVINPSSTLHSLLNQIQPVRLQVHILWHLRLHNRRLQLRLLLHIHHRHICHWRRCCFISGLDNRRCDRVRR